MATNYNTDIPITNENQDYFDRTKFARQITPLCANKTPNSIVVGIYGKWGEGKTSLNRLVYNALPDDIVKVNFLPWYFKDETQLLHNFLGEMAKALGKSLESKREKATRIFSKYSKALNPLETLPDIDGSVTIASSFAKFIGLFSKPLSIEKAKSRIDDFIVDAGKNIVVFIDDIDRLDVEEVKTVFKIVKLIADFPRTTYILSFDPELVARMLSPEYGGNIPDSGYEFLEKIIQVPLTLPAAHESSIQSYILDKIEKATGENMLQDKRFDNAFSGSFLSLLSTPRRAVRFGNTIQFSLSLLKGEVNICDLLIIEAIRVGLPEFYSFIRNNKQFFLNDYQDREIERYEGLKEPARKRIEEFIAIYPVSVRRTIRELICNLFPKFVWIDPMEYSYKYDKVADWIVNKRICTHYYFDRYFTYALQKDEIPDSHFDKYYLESDAHSLDELVEQYQSDFKKYIPDNLGFKLVHHRHKISLDRVENLIIGLCMISEHIPEKEPFNLGSPMSMIAWAIQSMIERMREKQAFEIAKRSIEVSSLIFASELVGRYTLPESEQDSKTLFSGIYALAIKKEYVSRVIEEMQQIGFYSAIPEAIMLRFIVLWAEIDKSAAKSELNKQLETDNGAYKLLEVFTPTVHSIGSDNEVVKTFKADFGQEEYSRIDDIVGADKLYDKLIKKYGDNSKLESLNDIGYRDGLSDVQLIGLFQKYHQESNK